MVCAQSRPYCATQVDMLIGCVLVQFLALSGMQNGPHMSINVARSLCPTVGRVIRPMLHFQPV